MGGSLNQPSRVRDDGPMDCKPLLSGSKDSTRRVVRVPEEKASANSVPAAAVIRRMRALSGFIGFKGCVGGILSQWSNREAQPHPAIETGILEWKRSMRNARCSGEMHRYHAELRLRRQHTGFQLTLKHESVGIEQD